MKGIIVLSLTFLYLVIVLSLPGCTKEPVVYEPNDSGTVTGPGPDQHDPFTTGSYQNYTFTVTDNGAETGLMRGRLFGPIHNAPFHGNEEPAIILKSVTGYQPYIRLSDLTWFTRDSAFCILGLSGSLEVDKDKIEKRDETLCYFASSFAAPLENILELTGGEIWSCTTATIITHGKNVKEQPIYLFTSAGKASMELQAKLEPFFGDWQKLWEEVSVPEEAIPDGTSTAWCRAFADAQLALPEENPYGSEEFRFLGVYRAEVSVIGDQLEFQVTLAAKNREGTPRLWICDGGWLGEGEWDGWVLNRRWVILARGEDGLWRAVDHAPYRLPLE